MSIAAAYSSVIIVVVLVAAETMTGREGLRAPALPHDRLVEGLREHKRLRKSGL